MKKYIYRAWVFDKDKNILISQEIYREDWNGLLGHLNKEIPEWKELRFQKINLEEGEENE
jgi:hypothetical protein